MKTGFFAVHANSSAPAGVNRTKVPDSCSSAKPFVNGELVASLILAGESPSLNRPVDLFDLDAGAV